MTYNITWHIPQKIILITYTDAITIEDLQGVNADLAAMHPEGNPPVHVVSYLQTNKFPTSVKTVRDIISTLSKPGWGWFIVVGFENALGRFLMTIITNTFNLQARAVSTIEEAEILVQRTDVSMQAGQD